MGAQRGGEVGAQTVKRGGGGEHQLVGAVPADNDDGTTGDAGGIGQRASAVFVGLGVSTVEA
ncbi:hypothetical protein AB0C47_13170 [Micromonospora taraxaci]|uniref:hypothetical protein n=1 Tax=Micromonospora taraxaci TaxID=1316803 RepID=UPI0033EC00EC